MRLVRHGICSSVVGFIEMKGLLTAATKHECVHCASRRGGAGGSGVTLQASMEFIAALSCAFFAGAAVYINAVEHPTRMSCGTEAAATQVGTELCARHLDAGSSGRCRVH